MSKRSIRLVGPGLDGKVPLPLLVELLEALQKSARAAMRARFGLSERARPLWLARATAMDLVGLHRGSAQLEIEAPDLSGIPELANARVDLSGHTCIDVLTSELNVWIDDPHGAKAKRSSAAYQSLLSVFAKDIATIEIDGSPSLRLAAEKALAVRQLGRTAVSEAMPTYTFDLSDETARLLPHNAGAEIRMAGAVKLFELGRLSSGEAARLAGTSRVEFLKRLADYGVPTFRDSAEDLRGDSSRA